MALRLDEFLYQERCLLEIPYLCIFSMIRAHHAIHVLCTLETIFFIVHLIFVIVICYCVRLANFEPVLLNNEYSSSGSEVISVFQKVFMGEGWVKIDSPME